MGIFRKLLDFLEALDQRKIFYRLGRVRDDTVMVEVALPVERWEVEFFGDGDIEAEIFRSDGHIASNSEAEEAIARMLREGDESNTPPVDDTPPVVRD